MQCWLHDKYKNGERSCLRSGLTGGVKVKILLKSILNQMQAELDQSWIKDQNKRRIFVRARVIG